MIMTKKIRTKTDKEETDAAPTTPPAESNTIATKKKKLTLAKKIYIIK